MYQSRIRIWLLIIILSFFSIFTSFLKIKTINIENSVIPSRDDSFSKQIFPTEITWGIGWGSPDMDRAQDVWADNDIIYVCGTVNENTQNAKLMLTKFVQNEYPRGSLNWSVNFTLGTPTYGKAVWSNGTQIYTAAETADYLIIINWDVNGSQLWNSTWTLNGNSGSLREIWGNKDAIYTIGTYLDDLLIIKWSAIDGTELWNRTWGGIGIDVGNGIWGDLDYIYTCGSTSSYGEGLNDSLIIKWDSDGNKIWNETWGTEYNEFFNSIWGFKSNLYVCGSKWNTNEFSTDVLIMKWDINGTWIWKKATGVSGDDVGNSIWANEYHVYIAGTFWREDEVNGNLVILKYSFSGDREERLKWGNSQDHETGESIFVDGDNLYVCGKYHPEHNQYILRYFSYSGIQPPTFLPVRPNPSPNGTFIVEWEEIPGADSYNVYKDIHPILDLSNRTPYQSITATNFTESNLPVGTYFYIVTTIINGSESVMSLPYIVEVKLPVSPQEIPGYNITILIIEIVVLTSLIMNKILQVKRKK